MGVLKMSDLPSKSNEYKQPDKSKTLRMCDILDAGSIKEKKIMMLTNRKVGEVFAQGEWRGQRCFIIGGGQSVNDFDLSLLKNEKTIGVNMAFRKLDPTILYGMDARLWGWIEQDELESGDCVKFITSKAKKVWSNINAFPLPEDILIAPTIGRPGISTNIKEGVAAGTNSGFGALNLALLLGASEIYLIGYDFYGKRWHKGYPHPEDKKTNGFHLGVYQESVDEIKKAFPNQRIINVNPESKLKYFEFGKMPKDFKTEEEKVGATVFKRKDKKKTDPVFVNYFSMGTGYEAYAIDLVESMKKFDIDMDVQAIKSRGNWDANIKFKPEYVLKMMDKYPGRPIVWVDADAVFVKFPEYMYSIKEHVGIHYYKKGIEPVTNLIYFSGGEPSKKLLKKWKKVCEDPKNKDVRNDQLLFQDLLETTKLKINKLPPEYCYILLGKNPEGCDPVVEQRQASRKLKT